MRAHVVRVRIASPVGPVAVVGTEAGVSQIYFDNGPRPVQSGRGHSPPTTVAPPNIPRPVRQAVDQLQQYFQGEPAAFQFPLYYGGTPFQRTVWEYLMTIPRGETRTYGEVAQAIGKPKAARAVGGAVGSNPLSIVIPCHRVVAADGQGGGYGGGMKAKRFLLQLEGVAL